MTYEVPASKRSLKQNQFKFKVPGDKTFYFIPKAKYLPVGVIEKLASNAEQVTLIDILAMFKGADEKSLEAIRTLDSEQLIDLTSAWQEDSGVTTGESSASSTS